MQLTAKKQAPFLPASYPPHIKKFPHALISDFPAKPSAARPLAPCYHGGRDPQETGRTVKNADYLPEIWVFSYFVGQEKVLTKFVLFEFTQKTAM